MNWTPDQKLKPCPFCGEDFQLQIVEVDRKNPKRNLIKCRKCRGEAPYGYWQKSTGFNHAIELLKKCFEKEIRMCVPCDTMYGQKIIEKRNKVVDELVALYPKGYNRIPIKSIVQIVEELLMSSNQEISFGDKDGSIK